MPAATINRPANVASSHGNHADPLDALDSIVIDVTRESALLSATDKFLQAYRQWVDSTEELITNVFESCLIEMVEEFESGDLPGNCREISDAVEKVAKRWRQYEEYVTQERPMPRPEFWGAIEGLLRAREGASPVARKPIEPISLLFEQKVPARQIAIMYSHDGLGPFMVNGQPQEHLVYLEKEKPGTVIPIGWVHPMHAAEEAAQRRKEATRLKRIKELSPPPTPRCPESLEELLRQKVPPKQIAEMKGVALAEVFAAARAIGIDLVKRDREENEEVYRRHNPRLEAMAGSGSVRGSAIPKMPGREEEGGEAIEGGVGEADGETDGILTSDLDDDDLDEDLDNDDLQDEIEEDRIEEEEALEEAHPSPANEAPAPQRPLQQIASNNIDDQIRELSGNGQNAMQIAKALGVKVQKVAAVIREAKRQQVRQEAEDAQAVLAGE